MPSSETSVPSFKVNSAKERLLCYAAAILSAKIANPNNPYAVEGLINSSIKEANELIERIYDDEKLKITLGKD